MWDPDPGNEQRFNAAHNLGQGVGALLRTIAGFSSAIWAFTWFDKEPSLTFFVVLGIWGVVSSLGAKPAFRPIAQLNGTIVGLLVFYYLIW